MNNESVRVDVNNDFDNDEMMNLIILMATAMMVIHHVFSSGRILNSTRDFDSDEIMILIMLILILMK